MSNPHDYNSKLLASGVLTADHITELVRVYQSSKGLTVDGKCGPLTRDHLTRDARPAVVTPNVPTFTLDDVLTVDSVGWLTGPGVKRMPIHPSWTSGNMRLEPSAIVAHYTATNPGTAVNMANNRADKRTPDDREASWHLSIESAATEFPIIQMAPFNVVCWHAGGGKPIPGVGPANQNAIGIELVGWGKTFPDQQVLNAYRVWRAIVKRYKMKSSNAMVQHSDLSPHDRSDPGPVWMGKYAKDVLAYAYM